MLVWLRPLGLLTALAMVQMPSAVSVPEPPARPPLEWSAVSIHLSNPEKPDDNFSNDQANGFTDRGMSLREVISQGFNFDVMPFREDEVEGLPKWAETARYDIVARVSPEDVPAFKKLSDLPTPELIAAFTARQPTGEMLMVQRLLSDRFHLKAHWEIKERSVYAATLAKGGVRMKLVEDPKNSGMSFDPGHLAGKGVPAPFLASLLSVPAGRKVVDRTGLKGAYDFDLRFTPENSSATAPSNEPDLFTAVQEQLGLRLESTRAKVPVLVIDHVEPPSAN